MSATTLTLTIEPGALDARSSWTELESPAVEMSREVPLRALEATPAADARERLVDSVCGPRWAPVRGLPASFACPRCEMAEDFARKGKRTRKRKPHTAVGTVELVLWRVGCRDCGRVFATLLVMLGLSGKRRTDRLTVDLAERGTQVDGTGARTGTNKNGVGANPAVGITGRSGPVARRRAHTHLLGLTVGRDWTAMAAQPPGLPAPAMVVLDGEAEITTLAQNPWPGTPIQRCWWPLPPGLGKAFYADDAANRHVNPHWARHTSERLGDLLRDSTRQEQTTTEALAAFDAFIQAIPDKLTSAHAYLAAARDHTFTCLDPAPRARLARLGGPELGTGVIERVMRETNARTDIGGTRWSVAGLRDLLTVHTARLLHHPTWKETERATHRPSTIPFRLQKFNA